MVGIVFSRTGGVFASDQVYTVVVVITLFQGLQSAVFMSPKATAVNETTPNCEVATHQDLLKGFPEYITKNLTPGVPFWLPVNRTHVNDSPGWFWISGEFYKNQLSPPPWHKKGMDCAALRADQGFIDDANCSASYSMYMCGPSTICNGNQSIVCIEHSGNYFSIHLKSGNWYQALQRCKKGRTRLAVLIPDTEAILVKIKKQLQNYPYPDVWIGLRMKEYQWTDGRPVEEFSWAPGSPCVCPELKCVAAMKEDGRVVWKQKHCHNNKSHHLCVALQSRIPTSASPPSKHKTTTVGVAGGTSPLIIAVAVIVPVMLGVAIVLSSAYFCFWQRRKQNQPQSDKPAVVPLQPLQSGTNEEEDTKKTYNPADKENMSEENTPLQQDQAHDDKIESEAEKDAAVHQPSNSDTDRRLINASGHKTSHTGPIVSHTADNQQIPSTQHAEEPIKKPELFEIDLRLKSRMNKATEDKKCIQGDNETTSRPSQERFHVDQVEEKTKIDQIISKLAAELASEYRVGNKDKKKAICNFIDQLRQRTSESSERESALGAPDGESATGLKRMHMEDSYTRERKLVEKYISAVLKASTREGEVDSIWQEWQNQMKHCKIPGVGKMINRVNRKLEIAKQLE